MSLEIVFNADAERSGWFFLWNSTAEELRAGKQFQKSTVGDQYCGRSYTD
jgi:hypothetical protein